MNNSIRAIAAALASMTLSAGLANAKVPEEEVAKLGVDLHPFGAEKAGNADGSIPEWTPKWKGLPPGLEYKGPGHTRPDPYTADKPALVITAQNFQDHKDKDRKSVV